MVKNERHISKELKITNVTELLAIKTQIAFEMSMALVAYCLKQFAVLK